MSDTKSCLFVCLFRQRDTFIVSVYSKSQNLQFQLLFFQELAGTSHADVNTGLGDVAAVGVHISEQTVGKPANCVKSSKRLNGIREVNKSENKTEKQK